MSKRVYITGIGIICAIGNNVAETFDSLLACRSGIGAITRLTTLHKGIIPMAEVKKTTEELLGLAGHPGSTKLKNVLCCAGHAFD